MKRAQNLGLALGLSLLPLFAFAGPNEGMLGTKAGAPMTAAAPGGSTSLLTTLFAIAIVVGLLKFGLPKFAQKIGAIAPNGGEIKIKSSTPLNTAGVHLVEVAGKTLLLGSTSNSIALLADLTPAATAVGATAPEPELFMDMVESAAAYVPPVFDSMEPKADTPVEVPQPVAPAAAVVSSAANSDLLARLDRLRGNNSSAAIR